MCFVGAIVSLFLPYLEKLNIRSGDLNQATVKRGSEYFSAHLAVISIGVNLLVCLISNSKVFSLLLSIVTLILVYFTRNMIHFQDFIDHDYDSKTGQGYVLLFGFAVLAFLASFVNVVFGYLIRTTSHA
jgi:hypothetical protein